MPIIFPPSPSINDEFSVAGKSWSWNGLRWQRFKSAIIDGGFANIEPNVADNELIADGGDA
jgi:hypothetical protein